MYLKIADEDNDNNKWWYVFDVKRMTESGIKFSKDLLGEIKIGDFDLSVLNDYPLSLPDQGYQILHCVLPDDKEYSIIFNTYGYLCTDEGETAERFVACKS